MLPAFEGSGQHPQKGRAEQRPYCVADKAGKYLPTSLLRKEQQPSRTKRYSKTTQNAEDHYPRYDPQSDTRWAA
jgi:hypothetical protein